jgi:hypothetical protein
MKRFTCTECGVIAASQKNLDKHRVTYHAKPDEFASGSSSPPPLPDPGARDREAVAFLSTRLSLLEYRERRFFYAVRYRVEIGRDLSPAQSEWLHELVAIVSGLLTEPPTKTITLPRDEWDTIVRALAYTEMRLEDKDAEFRAACARAAYSVVDRLA